MLRYFNHLPVIQTKTTIQFMDILYYAPIPFWYILPLSLNATFGKMLNRLLPCNDLYAINSYVKGDTRNHGDTTINNQPS